MRAGSMNALIGADQSIKVSAVPMKAYREAKQKNDTDAMERAMGYAEKFAGKAEKYSEKAGDEALRERRAESRQLKLDREEAIRKAREERKSARELCEAKTAPTADRAELSESGKAAALSAGKSKAAVSESPDIYDENGRLIKPEAPVSIEARA